MPFDFIPKKSSVLVIGSPRSEKAIFAEQFLLEGLKAGEKAVYFISNDFPENVTRKLLDQISDKELQNMRIIDCYTLHANVEKPDEGIILRATGPYALNEISIAFTKVIKEISPQRAIVNSISTLILHNKPNEIEEFLEFNIRKLRSKGTTVLLLVEEGLHDSKYISTLESLTSVTIKFDSNNHEMTIKNVGEEKKIKYKLEKNQIICD